MYLSFSKTIARFGGFRIGIGKRLTKKNAPYMFFALMFVYMAKFMWYMMIAAGWLIYVVFYGMFWGIKKIVKACKKSSRSKSSFITSPTTPYTDCTTDDSMTEDDRCAADVSTVSPGYDVKPNNKADVARWVVGGFFVAFALVNGFHYSSLFLIVSAFLMFPFGFMKELYTKINIKTVIVIIASSVLLAVGALLSPLAENSDVPSSDLSDDADNGDSANTNDKADGDGVDNGNSSNNTETDNGSGNSQGEGVVPDDDNQGASGNDDENQSSNTDNDNDNQESEDDNAESGDDSQTEPDGANGSTEDSEEDGSTDVNDNEENENISPPDTEEGNGDSTDDIIPEVQPNKVYLIAFSATLKENNHVGEDWVYELKRNNESIISGTTISTSASETLHLVAHATETDANGDDHNSATLIFSNMNVSASQTQTITITVRENNGKYQGNSATVEFTVTVERLQ